MGRFITFEGVEGSGKTTQVRMAKSYLEAEGLPLVATDEPGGTPLGKIIREMLLNVGPYAIFPHAELLLFMAARAQHVQEVIRPALQQGKLVLCDRFLDATLAYQGWGRGLDRAFIETLHDFATNSLKPHLTILLDLPAENGLQRALERIAQRRGGSPEDRFEREDLAFHQRIREGYLALASKEPTRYRIIDASREVAVVHRDVCSALAAFISS